MPAALLCAAVLAGCGNPKADREWAPDRAEREHLEQWAGSIARSLVPPGNPGDLDPDGLRRLMAHCDSVPQRYVYLYGRLSDSIQAITPPEPGCVRDGTAPDHSPHPPAKEDSSTGR